MDIWKYSVSISYYDDVKWSDWNLNDPSLIYRARLIKCRLIYAANLVVF